MVTSEGRAALTKLLKASRETSFDGNARLLLGESVPLNATSRNGN